MPWTEEDYPPEMEELSAEVRAKAIEIANRLVEEKHMDEDAAIREAIKEAEEWDIDELG